MSGARAPPRGALIRLLPLRRCACPDTETSGLNRSPPAGYSPGMSQENAEVVRQMLDAFNRDHAAKVVGFFAEDCELHEPPEMVDSAGGFRGHDGIRAWMANLRDVVGVRFEPVSLTARGDLIVAELAAHGRGEASGAPFAWTTFAAVRLRDARIVRVQAFLTQEEALHAAGWIAQQPPPRPARRAPAP
jgi:ketosteroid isomerase-like protein